jgi:hypothetical protein
MRRVDSLLKTCVTVSVLVASWLAIAAPARANGGEAHAVAPRKDSVNADVGLAVIGLGYHRVLHPRVEIQLQAQFFSPWFVTPGVGGFGGQLRPYFFLSGSAPAGVYISPFVRAAYVLGRIGEVEGAGPAVSVGAAFGQSFLLARRVALRGGLGLQYLSYEVRSESATAKIQTLYPTIDLSLGITF